MRTKRREDVTQIDCILGVPVEVGTRRDVFRPTANSGSHRSRSGEHRSSRSSRGGKRVRPVVALCRRPTLLIYSALCLLVHVPFRAASSRRASPPKPMSCRPAGRVDPWRGEPPMIITESRSLAGGLRDLASEYLTPIASTNGQAGGFSSTLHIILTRRP